MTGGFGSATSQGMGFFSSCFTALHFLSLLVCRKNEGVCKTFPRGEGGTAQAVTEEEYGRES